MNLIYIKLKHKVILLLSLITISCVILSIQIKNIDLGILTNNANKILVSIIILSVITIIIILLDKTNYFTKHEEEKKNLYYNAISNLYIYSLKINDWELFWDINNYIVKLIIHEQKKNQKVTYPKEYLQTLYEAHAIISSKKEHNLYFSNLPQLYLILIDQQNKSLLSENTLSLIWKCLLLDITYNNQKQFISYWKFAHQHFEFYLKKTNHLFDSKGNITNKKEIEIRDEERRQFLEFHYALGGLLLYKEKYNLIKEITSYTNSIPAKYVLVPQTLAEVIFQYMNTGRKLYDVVYYQRRYEFPGIVGANTEYAIQKWIKNYLAILFLRQYTISQNEIYSDPLQMPQIPEGQAEKQAWDNQLDYLLESVNKYLKDTELLKAVGLEQLTNENFFEVNIKETPEILIKRYKAEITKSREETEKNQDLDPSKVKDFNNKTQEILGKSIKRNKEKWLTGTIDKDYLNIGIKGKLQIMEKNAFAKDQVSTYLNANSILAESIKREFQYFAPNIMYRMQKTDFLLKEADVFKAIDSLELDSEIFVILSFGNYINHYQSEFQVSNLEETKKGDKSKWTYKNIEIIDIECLGSDLFFYSFVIIKKEDLPDIIPHDISEDTITKYDLKSIDTENYIYASIIDLNKNKVLKEEIEKQQGATDLSKSVLACIMMNLEIRCKTSAKCIQLKVSTEYTNKGTPNKLSEVKSIW